MTEMNELLFGEGLLEPTLRGDKLITIRKYRAGAHDFKRDEIVKGVFKEGMTVLLRIRDDTEKKPFKQLKDSEAREDGYKDAKDAFNGLKVYYQDLKKSDTAAIIRFEVLRVNDIPVVSLNRE